MRLGGIVIGVAAASVVASAALAQDPTATLADTVRDRGHPCAKPVSSERDPNASRPDEAVWILTCSDARYRIRYPGDTAPQVERID
ncbi:MAG: hypothetical protein AB7I59_12395 [Geminicoccaceae bacterium]